MITILHGDNIVASRNRLGDIRRQAVGKEIITFSTQPDLTVLIQSLESGSFFADTRLVILEGMLGAIGRKKTDAVLDYLSKGDFSTDCILWESKAISPGMLSHFPKNTKVELFKLSKTLFKWLDNLSFGNVKETLSLYHQCLHEAEPELLFAMLVRQVRLLLAVQTGVTKLEEVSRLAPWQREKLTRQAQQFSKDQLILFHRRLYELDLEQKTGQNILSLEDSLDILLTEV